MKCKLLALFAVILAIIVIQKGSSIQETAMNVKFEVLTGSGVQDYYSGDYFWYNISLTNSGTTAINSTFTVTVRNTTGGVFGAVQTYRRYLEPNGTITLYPNYTRLGKEEVFVYFMDTVGTYTIELTSDIPMSFYRYYESGRYTVEYNKSHMNIDAMPSYQRVQNDRWIQFLQENKNYMNTVETYIEQSRIETSKTKALAFSSVMVALISLFVAIVSIPKTTQKRLRTVLYLVIVFVVILLAYLILYGI